MKWVHFTSFRTSTRASTTDSLFVIYKVKKSILQREKENGKFLIKNGLKNEINLPIHKHFFFLCYHWIGL
jgi:hypothetical protein